MDKAKEPPKRETRNALGWLRGKSEDAADRPSYQRYAMEAMERGEQPVSFEEFRRQRTKNALAK
jgi:hypothetical protein